MEIVLIRHARPGRSEAESEGGSDPELNEIGQAQARKIADFVSASDAPIFDGVYCSTMRRAVQTATPIAERLGLSPVADADLVEYDHGLGFYIPTEEITDFDGFWNDLQQGLYGGHRIDIAAFQQRVVAAIDRIIARHASDHRVAIVCHGGVVSAYIASVVGSTQPFICEPDYTSISRVHVNAAGRRMLLSVNETPHVGFANWNPAHV